MDCPLYPPKMCSEGHVCRKVFKALNYSVISDFFFFLEGTIDTFLTQRFLRSLESPRVEKGY